MAARTIVRFTKAELCETENAKAALQLSIYTRTCAKRESRATNLSLSLSLSLSPSLCLSLSLSLSLYIYIRVQAQNAEAALQIYVVMSLCSEFNIAVNRRMSEHRKPVRVDVEILPQHFLHATHETTNPNVAYHKLTNTDRERRP